MKESIKLLLCFLFMIFIGLDFVNADSDDAVYWDVEVGSPLESYLRRRSSYFSNHDIELIEFNNVAITKKNTVDYDYVLNSGDVKIYYVENKKKLSIEFFGTLYLNESMANLFRNFYNVEYITGFEYIDTSNVTNMNDLFYDCNNLKELDLSSFNTSKVTEMRSMFFGCKSLTTLKISNFDTKNVINMAHMFFGCSSLINLDLNTFNTSNVEVMSYMFANCNNIRSLDLSNFNTSKVINMSGMFYGMKNIIYLDLSNFDTNKVIEIENMFGEMDSLETIYVSNKFVVNVNNTNMFTDDINLVGYIGTKYIKPFYPDSFDCYYARIDSENNPGYFSIKGGISSDLYTIDEDKKTIDINGNNFDIKNIKTDNVNIEYDNFILFVYYHDLLLSRYSIVNPIKSITLDKKSLSLVVGKTYELYASINPINTTDDTMLTWESSDSNIVSVDDNGIISALSPGNATITVYTVNGKSDTINIRVKESASDFLPGDMNDNGKIDLQDIILLLKKYLNNDATSDEIEIGDMDNDGSIGLKDIIMLLKAYLGGA